MVDFSDEELVPAPRAIIWKLLNDHLDDKKITTIHPLIQSQTTVSHTGNDTLVDRVIDTRGKMLKSRWMLTLEPPEHYRWEVHASEGPWAPGTYMDLRYEQVPGGTRVLARGALTISVLPFFLSQKRTVARVLNDISIEDSGFLNRYRF
jgi:hypothetical protein